MNKKTLIILLTVYGIHLFFLLGKYFEFFPFISSIFWVTSWYEKYYSCEFYELFILSALSFSCLCFYIKCNKDKKMQLLSIPLLIIGIYFFFLSTLNLKTINNLAMPFNKIELCIYSFPIKSKDFKTNTETKKVKTKKGLFSTTIIAEDESFCLPDGFLGILKIDMDQITTSK